MPKRLLDYDPVTGLKTYHEYDHQTRKTTIGYEHDDLSPVLDWNHDQETSGLHDRQRKKDIWHCATIPEAIILKWRTEEGLDIYNPNHWKGLQKKLNDPEWKYLRTWKGRI